MASVAIMARAIQPEPLAALQAWLMDQHYSQHATEQIVAWTEFEGTPTGSPYLDREDEATANEVFIEAMPLVRHTSNDWDDAGIWIDLDTLLEAGRPAGIPVEDLVPPELDPEEDAAIVAGWGESPSIDPEPYEPTPEDELAYAAWQAAGEPSIDPGPSEPAESFEAAAAVPPPISGGAPAGPTAEDWADYREWAERVDRLEALLRDLPDDPQYGYE